MFKSAASSLRTNWGCGHSLSQSILQIQTPLRSEKNAFSIPEGGKGETTKKGHIRIMEIPALSEPHAHRPRQKSATGRKEREVVVITGASAGVGRAAVRAFASRGACI